MRSIVERIVFGLLRVAATVVLFAGISLVAAGGALMASASAFAMESAQGIAAGALGVAAAFLVAGGLALYFGRRGLQWFQDDRGVPIEINAASAGWRLLLVVTLVAIPAWLFFGLQPLGALWRDLFALADAVDFWKGIGDSGGLVLMPVMAVLAIPAIQTAAAVASVLTSVFLIALMLVRSTKLPRALLLCVLLQGALVLASTLGTVGVARLTPRLEQLVRETADPAGTERARNLEAIERYGMVVTQSSHALLWPWAAFAVWLTIVVLDVRSRTSATGAVPRAEDATSGAPQTPFVAMDDETRARAYADAARQVDRSTRPSGGL